MARQRNMFFAFTLVELMAAVSVVMILVALALPRYRLFIASSRQAEANANLGIIATLQQSYQLKFDGQYFDSLNMGGSASPCSDDEQKNPLGFRAVSCDDLRYKYTTSSTNKGGGSAKNDGSISTKYIYPGCTETDEWTITEQRQLENKVPVIQKCHN